MKALKGKAILTINDHPDMRKVFAGLTTKAVGINHTVGGAGKGVQRQELIVKSW